MATMNINEIGVGAGKVTGAIFVAPKGTTLPTDAVTALNNAFKLLGFTSDAGVTISESRSTSEITAWEGRTIVLTAVTQYTENVSFTPIQCNEDVVKLMWGTAAVTVSNGALAIGHHGKMLDPVEIVIESVSNDSIGRVRRYAGTFELVERGEQTLDGTQVDGRQLSFRAVPDANGITMHEYVAAITGSTN